MVAALDKFNAVFEIIGRFVQICMVVLMAGTAFLALDREPPYKLLHTYPVAGKPGETVAFAADVQRQTHRRCSANMSQSIFDSTNRRHDLGESYFSVETIEKMERDTPGKKSPMVEIPAKAAPGQAALVSSLRYGCNATHRLKPIEVTTVEIFTILPP